MNPLRTIRNQRGHGYIELALILPIILLISLASLEFSRSLKYIQVATVLSREAASMAFRNCIWERNTQNAQSCLESVRAKIEQFGSEHLAGTGIILSLYTYDGPQGECNNQVRRLAVVGEGTFQSNFGIVEGNESELSTANFNKQTLCDNRVLIISETHVPYQAIIGSLPKMFSYNPLEFYASTLI